MTNTKRRQLLKALGVGGTIGLAGCLGGDGDGGDGDGDGDGDGGTDEPIRIGTNYPMSGGLALMGTEAMRGVELWANQTNANGGINGREVELIKMDAPDADSGVSNVEALATSEDADIIVGSFSSSIAQASSEAAGRYDIVYWETTGFAPSISEPGYDHVFHTNARTTNYGAEGISVIENIVSPELDVAVGDMDIAIMYEDGEFGSATRDEMRANESDVGYTIVEEIGYPAFQTDDMSSAIERLKQAEPDVLYHSGYDPDTYLLWQQAQELDFYVPAVVGNGTAYVLQGFVEAVGEQTAIGIINMDQPHYNTHPDFAPGVADILAAYRDEYGENPTSQLPNTTFSVMQIFAEAAANAASFSPADMEEAVLSLDMPFGSLPNGWGASFDEEHHRNQRVRVAGTQWQPDEYTDDIFHPDRSDGTLDVYTLHPEDGKLSFVEPQNIPRPDYTQ